MILLSIDIQKEFSTGTQKVPAVLGEQNGPQLGGDGGGERTTLWTTVCQVQGSQSLNFEVVFENFMNFIKLQKVLEKHLNVFPLL